MTLLVIFFVCNVIIVNSFTPISTAKQSRSFSLNQKVTRNSRIAQNTKKIVLVGGGHAHLQVIKAFNKRDRPKDWHVTLIDKSSFASYSGMVPGCVSNIYTKDVAQIALRPLSEWASIDFVQDTVVNVDAKCQQVLLKNGKVIDYDVLSLDIGSMSKGTDTPGVLEFTIPTRPIDALVDRLEEAKKRLPEKGSVKAVVVGGGIAGIELAMCMHSGFEYVVDDVNVTILDSGTELIPFESEICREGLQNVLDEKKISVRFASRVNKIKNDFIELEDGARIPFTHCVWSTGASPHPISSQLRQSGISTSTDGWIKVRPTLQTHSHNNIFAAGDCASIEGLLDSSGQKLKESPPKAGVYAVRSGPVLIENISRFLKKSERSCEPLITFDPQDDFLKLIGCGDGTALGFRFGLLLRGKWVWELKDFIDRMFMDLFKVENLPDLSEDACNGDGKDLDTSQYDDLVKKSERLGPKEAGKLLLRQYDDVNYQDAWDVIREMAADDKYKQDVLEHCTLQPPLQMV